MARLTIATPAFDPRVCLQTYRSMLELDTCGMGVSCATPAGYTIVEARTRAVEAAMEDGADWLLFVDSDVVPPRDGLANLLSHGVDVCFGYYSKGGNDDGRTCLCDVQRDNYDSFICKDALHEMADDGETLLQVRGGGFGFALVGMGVFSRIKEPWFDYPWDRRGRKLSEDYVFCTKCRQAGMRLWADTRVDCGHVREVVR